MIHSETVEELGDNVAKNFFYVMVLYNNLILPLGIYGIDISNSKNIFFET